MSERLYKVLNEDGSAFHGGTGVWSLPQDGNPGEWMPPIDKLNPCASGYHLCREQDLVSWLGPAIYRAEARGARIDCDDKIVVSEARLLSPVTAWDESSSRLFACDCAEHVLPLYEEQYPEDDRPRRAIETARRYAIGEATADDLAAAGAAARAASWEAAAAGAAHGAASWVSERSWQTQLLSCSCVFWGQRTLDRGSGPSR